MSLLEGRRLPRAFRHGVLVLLTAACARGGNRDPRPNPAATMGADARAHAPGTTKPSAPSTSATAAPLSTADPPSVPSASAQAPAASATPRGARPGVWVKLDIPVGAFAPTAGGAQTVLVDPVRPSDFYAFVSAADTEPTAVLKSTDFGVTWRNVNTTAELHGIPWGAAIDPNPNRRKETPPTLYAPAGFGAQGVWKSVDGGVTWSNLLHGSTVFDAYKPYWGVDAYQIGIAPDDPPNHILFTYHYGFKSTGGGPQGADGGFGESTDGGRSWVVHPPPAGIGNSHYLILLSSTTWLAVAQPGSGAHGIWRTRTAGRIGGKVNAGAWERVDAQEHVHGAFQHYVDRKTGALYVPGMQGLRVTRDQGTTWTTLRAKISSSLAATGDYLYMNSLHGPDLVRASRNDPATWVGYAETPSAMMGSSPYGVATAYDGQRWVIVLGGQRSGLWRYVE